VRRAATGGLILELTVPENDPKAIALAAKLREVLHGKGIKVATPTKVATIYVRNMDASVTKEEIATAVCGVDSCSPDDVIVNTL